MNSGLIVAVEVFDAYPFGLLGIILSVEAILITGFLLISQKRQDVHAEKRAELEYEVNVRSYRKIRDLQDTLEAIATRIERLEKRLIACAEAVNSGLDFGAAARRLLGAARRARDYFAAGRLTQIPLQSAPPLVASQSSEGSSTHTLPSGHGKPAMPPQICFGWSLPP